MIHLLRLIWAVIEPGDKLYLSVNSQYITFDGNNSGVGGAKDDSLEYTAVRHDSGGISFLSESENRALNFSANKNSFNMYYTGTEKANNNWVTDEKGGYTRLINQYGKCDTLVGRSFDFKMCDNGANQKFRVEFTNKQHPNYQKAGAESGYVSKNSLQYMKSGTGPHRYRMNPQIITWLGNTVSY